MVEEGGRATECLEDASRMRARGGHILDFHFGTAVAEIFAVFEDVPFMASSHIGLLNFAHMIFSTATKDHFLQLRNFTRGEIPLYSAGFSTEKSITKISS